MSIEFVEVSRYGVGPTAELLTRAFADYLVKITLNEAALRAMMRVDSVDPDASLVVVADGTPAGAALIARRGTTSRVAGMAFVPTLRRRGLGRALMNEVIGRAGQRADERILLEVIAENRAAVALYESIGFRRMRRLLGFTGAGATDSAASELEPVSLRAAGEALEKFQDADWPWQISGQTIAALASPHLAYRCGTAWIVITDPAAETITVRGLGGASENLDGAAADAVRAVRRRHPGRQWRASALWPETVTGWFTGAGMGQSALSQWQMELRLLHTGTGRGPWRTHPA